MAFFDKLMFWKKKEGPLGTDLGLKDSGFGGNDLGLGKSFNDYGAGHDPGLGKDTTGLGGTGGFGRDFAPPQTPSFPQQQPFQQQPPAYPSYPQGAPMMPQQPSQHEMVGKDMEIISSKLDALRMTLESINQRIANLERIAYGEQEKKRRW